MIGQPRERVDYPLVQLIPATTPRGMCACCAAHWWLYSVDGIRWACEQSTGDILRMPGVRQALSGLLGMMHPELGRIDWGRLLAQWDMPWPADWQLPRDAQHAR